MTGPPYRPIDARVYPRFAGVRTFMRLPHVTELAGVDAAVYGIPFDTAVTYRPGTRFGPEAIRSASALLRPYHSGFGIDLCEALSIVDYGDLPVAPGDTEGTYRRVEEGLAPIVDAGIFPLALGGDHSITLAELRVLAQKHGPRRARPARRARRHVGRVLRPALLPRHDVSPGGRGRARRSGASVQAGMRGPLFQGSDLDDARALGFHVLPSEELRALGPVAYGELVRERVGSRPVFLSFDIDFLDPAHAPGTGTPEVAGFSTAEAVAFLRALRGIAPRRRRRRRGLADVRRAGPDHGARRGERRVGAAGAAGRLMIVPPNRRAPR